jgi:hypothetical protein
MYSFEDSYQICVQGSLSTNLKSGLEQNFTVYASDKINFVMTDGMRQNILWDQITVGIVI